VKNNNEHFLHNKLADQFSIINKKFAFIMFWGGLVGATYMKIQTPEAVIFGATLGGATGGIIYLIDLVVHYYGK
jgi:hypothetical protein